MRPLCPRKARKTTIRLAAASVMCHCPCLLRLDTGLLQIELTYFKKSASRKLIEQERNRGLTVERGVIEAGVELAKRARRGLVQALGKLDAAILLVPALREAAHLAAAAHPQLR